MATRIKVSYNMRDITGTINKALKNDKMKLAIHNIVYKQMEPYVPFDTGDLAVKTVAVTEKSIKFTTPYAHYMYQGVVYGPNIPIIENGVVVGFYSVPEKTKTPTGALLEYNKGMHPLATSHWDKAMLRDKREVLENEIGALIEERIKKE